MKKTINYYSSVSTKLTGYLAIPIAIGTRNNRLFLCIRGNKTSVT